MSGDQNRSLAGNGVFLILNLILPYWKSMEFCPGLSWERDIAHLHTQRPGSAYKSQAMTTVKKKAQSGRTLNFNTKMSMLEKGRETERDLNIRFTCHWTSLLNALVETFSFLHNSWSIKNKGKQENPKDLSPQEYGSVQKCSHEKIWCRC